MRASELRELSEQELGMKEAELRESVFRFRMRRGTNQLDNPAALRKARRDIARVETIRGERRRKAEQERSG
jgi:large subunit ribosomal protein L29